MNSNFKQTLLLLSFVLSNQASQSVPIEKSIAWIPEAPPKGFKGEPAIRRPMNEYYQELFADGTVSIFLGYGKDAFHAERARELYELLQSLGKSLGLGLTDWYFNSDTSELGFTNPTTGIMFDVQIGHERNEWADALAHYEVVMYHGHSRYGRGPAFGEYSNYFRMGNVFPIIEVDVRNPYFLNEKIEDVSTYPPQMVSLGGTDYSFQYRGQLIDSSYLSSKAYTKRIPGLDADLRAAHFLAGRQLLWFYSCSNEAYWKQPLRLLFPDVGKKFVFGTREPGYWSAKPAATFLLALARQVSDSQRIVQELNAVGDCKNCFTSY